MPQKLYSVRQSLPLLYIIWIHWSGNTSVLMDFPQTAINIEYWRRAATKYKSFIVGWLQDPISGCARIFPVRHSLGSATNKITNTFISLKVTLIKYWREPDHSGLGTGKDFKALFVMKLIFNKRPKDSAKLSCQLKLNL